MTPMARRILLAISLLSVAGIAISSVSLYHHYGTSPTSYCDFGETFNCDIVNRSVYSTVDGIPVALIGILGYATLLVIAAIYRTRSQPSLIVLSLSTAGLGFALYLTYIEKYVLGVWCVLCLSSLGVIFSIVILAACLMVHSRNQT